MTHNIQGRRSNSTQKMCTVKKHGNLYLLTLVGNDQHRFNPTLITSIRSSLAQIKSQFSQTKSASALITTAHGKFFSNGYDLSWVKSTSNPEYSKTVMDSLLRSLVHDLIRFPMPTIAAVTGHASAAGMILAMAHDYVIMRRERGYLYMSEVDIGLVIPEWFMGLLKCKIADSRAMVKVVLAGAKVTGEMGKEIGMVDAVGEGVEGTVDKAVEMGKELVARGWDGVVYGEIRKGLFKDVLDLIGAVELQVDDQENGKVEARSRL